MDTHPFITTQIIFVHRFSHLVDIQRTYSLTPPSGRPAIIGLSSEVMGDKEILRYQGVNDTLYMCSGGFVKLSPLPYASAFTPLDAHSSLQFPIDVPRATLMHDMAITENYAVFLDLPMVVKSEMLLKGKAPFVYDDTLEARYAK